MKTGLVLEGGAMREIYTSGVLDVFLDCGIRFNGVIGVSAGAIHGATYVAEQNGRNIRYYKNYRRDRHFMSIYSLVTTGDVVSRDFCYREIPDRLDPFDYETFKSSPTDFYVACTDVEKGTPVYVLISATSGRRWNICARRRQCRWLRKLWRQEAEGCLTAA